MLNSQKGFAIILILIAVLGFIGVAGASYFLTTNFVKSKNPSISANDPTKTASIKPEESKTNKSDSVVNSSQKINTSGKILTVSNEGKLQLVSADGKEITPLNNKLDEIIELYGGGVYPDSISPDRSNLLLSGFSKDKKSAYVILSLKDGYFYQIDYQKFKLNNEFGELSIWTWTPDSQGLVYSTKENPESLPGTIKRTIGIYDFNTKEVREIYSEEELKSEFFPAGFAVINYDPEKQILTYIDDNAPSLKEAEPGRSEGRVLDLRTKQKIVFKQPDMYTHVSRVFGKYFVKSNEDPAVPYSRNKLQIFDSTDPNKPLGEIVLDQDQYFNTYTNWSPDYKYFSVQFNQRYDDTKNELRIYSKDGKLVFSTPTPKMYYGSAIFSGNNKRALVFDTTENVNSWKVFELDSGKLLYTASSDNLGRPILYFD